MVRLDQSNHESLDVEGEEEKWVRKTMTEEEAREIQSVRGFDSPLLALKIEEGNRAKKCRQCSAAENGP